MLHGAERRSPRDGLWFVFRGFMSLADTVPAHLPVPAARTDLDELVRLETFFPETDRISRQSWQNFLRQSGGVWIVRNHHELAGAAVLLFRKNSGIARLYSIVVAPEFSGLGLGRALLERCEQEAIERECGRIRLEVRVSNTRAIDLYRRYGFTDMNRLTAYYDDGEDAIRMEKKLTDRTHG